MSILGPLYLIPLVNNVKKCETYNNSNVWFDESLSGYSKIKTFIEGKMGLEKKYIV